MELEILLERLRTKSSSTTFPELAKATRMTLLEKRYALDAVEKANLQKCLDSMQHCIKVTSRQGLVERLESLTRQLGLKFNEDNTSGLFISSDMFYLEIVLDTGGAVQDVKVHHECKIEQQSCSELVNCLVKGDFADFTTQLEGLASIYQLNAEPKIKSKAFVALQALETDLQNLFQVTNFYKDVSSLLLQSPLGIVQKRRGGHPMKLTYFVPPYELLDLEAQTLQQLSVDLIHSKNFPGAFFVTVNLEASVAHKLPIQPILNLTGNDPQNLSYAQLNNYNSTMLPASFVLTLNKPMAVCTDLIAQITKLTELNFNSDDHKPAPILSLIGKQASNGEIINSSKGLLVTLPDQNHCYFMSENRSMNGVVAKSIPFTDTAHVSRIVQLLRQQALFNTLISSCVRHNNRSDFDNMTMFEVCSLSWQHISVSLEHPFEESMATVEFDLSNISSIECKISSIGGKQCSAAVTAKLSRIVQLSLSIPVTMRALIKVWEEENVRQQQMSRNGGESGNGFHLGSAGDLNGRGSGNSNGDGSNGSGGSGSGIKGILMERTGSNGSGSLMMNSQSPDLSSNQLDFLDNSMDQQQIKKRRITGEDFWRSPKRMSSSDADHQQQATVTSNDDSNSLGGSNLIAGMESNSQSRESGSGRVWSEDLSNGPFLSKSSSQDGAKGKLKFAGSQENEEDEFNENAFDMDENEDFDEDEEERILENGLNNSDSENDFELDEEMDLNPPDLEELGKLRNSEIMDGNEFEEEDEDIGSILNEIKNDKSSFGDLNELLFNSKSPKKGGKDLKVMDEKVQKMATPFVSITPITPSTNSSTQLPLPSPTNTITAAAAPSTAQKMGQDSKLKSVLSEMGIQEKRLGIEIIPIPSTQSSSSTTSSSSASVTITPIASSSSTSSSSSAQIKPIKKPSSSSSTSSTNSSSLNSGSSRGGFSSDEKRLLDSKQLKKKRRREEEYQMGPPEKLLKESKSSSMSPKYSTSPGSKSSKISPRQSPVHYSSPKHGISSPKGSPYASASPKHGTSSGSGKPSMSTLKSAANSPKNSEKKSSSSSKDRDREKKASSRSNSPKLKHSSVKLKPIDLNSVLLSQDDSNQSLDGGKNSSQKARKSSLSAVIDKLKSAQNSPEELLALAKQSEKSKDSKTQSSSTSNPNKTGNNGSSTSSYIIKPSLDGMKLTINKTKHKGESSKSGSFQSQKTHTGLKPGVNSGPASKKSSSPSSSKFGSKLPFQKSNSSGSLSSSSSSKSSALTKNNSGGDLSKVGSIGSDFQGKSKEKSKSKLSSSDNSFPRDPNEVMKLLGFPSGKQTMEGFMKTLDKKFQIPKLSARSSSQDENNKKQDPLSRSGSSSTASPSTPIPLVMSSSTGPGTVQGGLPPTPTSTEAKNLSDFLIKEVPLKFPFPLNLNQNFSPSHLAMPPQTSPKFNSNEGVKSSLLDGLKDEILRSTPPQTPKTQSPFPSPLNTSRSSTDSPLAVQNQPQDLSNSVTIEAVQSKAEDLSKSTIMRPPSVPLPNHHHPMMSGETKSIIDPTNVALDFSKQKPEISGNSRKNVSPTFRSNSPAISLHIVKSPAPSPLTVIPSPHSNSPCITDDELMDEALVGISGK